MTVNGHGFEKASTIGDSDFFKGSLAAASLSGVEAISTISDAHQVMFKGLVDELERRRTEQDTSTTRMPNFYPGPITGTYNEFDEALINLQNVGITRPVGPHFHAVEVTPDPDFAEHILERFTEPERALLMDLSRAFMPKKQ